LVQQDGGQAGCHGGHSSRVMGSKLERSIVPFLRARKGGARVFAQKLRIQTRECGHKDPLYGQQATPGMLITDHLSRLVGDAVQ
jgi:hypothetical protein